MGTQIHAGDNYRRVVELVQSGAIGNVTDVHVWVGRAWGWHENEAASKAANDIVFVQDRPAQADPIPAGLDWDLWLGPAPERPFNNLYVPGPKWYRWWDFGNGTMSDLGSHWIDLPFWAMNLDHPLTIEASGPAANREVAPASMEAKYTYGARGDRGPLSLTWYQGTHKPQLWHDNAIPQWDSGVLFLGDKGMLLADYGKHLLLPEDQFKDFEAPEPFIPASKGHYAEWIHACKTGEPTTCNFEYAGWLTEANHLGNVAYRVGKKIEWDAATMKAKDLLKLFGVHGFIGVGQQCFGRLAMVGIRAEPEGSTYRKGSFLRFNRLLNRLQQIAAHRLRTRHIGGIGQENHKLIAAHPRDRVTGPDGRHHTRSDFGENRVPCPMAVLIIDGLKSIQIHEDHKKSRRITCRQGDTLFQAFKKQVAIGQARQRIVYGQVVYLCPLMKHDINE